MFELHGYEHLHIDYDFSILDGYGVLEGEENGKISSVHHGSDSWSGVKGR